MLVQKVKCETLIDDELSESSSYGKFNLKFFPLGFTCSLE